jgi:hypothetical protein
MCLEQNVGEALDVVNQCLIFAFLQLAYLPHECVQDGGYLLFRILHIEKC